MVAAVVVVNCLLEPLVLTVLQVVVDLEQTMVVLVIHHQHHQTVVMERHPILNKEETEATELLLRQGLAQVAGVGLTPQAGLEAMAQVPMAAMAVLVLPQQLAEHLQLMQVAAVVGFIRPAILAAQAAQVVQEVAAQEAMGIQTELPEVQTLAVVVAVVVLMIQALIQTAEPAAQVSSSSRSINKRSHER